MGKDAIAQAIPRLIPELEEVHKMSLHTLRYLPSTRETLSINHTIPSLLCTFRYPAQMASA